MCSVRRSIVLNPQPLPIRIAGARTQLKRPTKSELRSTPDGGQSQQRMPAPDPSGFRTEESVGAQISAAGAVSERRSA